MKGLSGAVTAMILVIASVIMALLVVGFAFNLFGAMGEQESIKLMGVGSVIPCPNSGYSVFNITIPVYVAGGQPVAVDEVVLNGRTSWWMCCNTIWPGGMYTATVQAHFQGGFYLAPGTEVQVDLFLSNGETVPMTAIVQPQPP